MANYSTNEFRSGLKIIIDNDPCIIVENEFVKPGKGQAFNRVKLRNLNTGRVWERTFKSGESLEGADWDGLEKHVRMKGETVIKHDWISFDSVDEAMECFNVRCGEIEGYYV